MHRKEIKRGRSKSFESPVEPDYSMIYKDYVIKSDNYPDIYNFRSLLDRIVCDCSEYPQDWFNCKDGIIRSHWLIFVCAIPKDVERLECVANRMGLDISIIDEEDDDLMMLPFA